MESDACHRLCSVNVVYCWPTVMADIQKLLNRWTSAGLLTPPAAARILAWEAEQKNASLSGEEAARTTTAAGLAWHGVVALILGGILLATGVILFVSAHWDDIGPGGRFALVIAMLTVFHLGGALVRDKYRGLSTTLHAVGTIAPGSAIALVGQIFNIEEHWPAAILLWAIAALAGWVLLHDQVQQVLTFVLFPAWMLCELAYHAGEHIGREI